MYYWDGTGWNIENDTGVVLSSDVSGYAGYVWANVTHLSMFALIGKPPPAGDINFDGTVNILDIFIVANAFGSKPGDENWNATADLNKDGTVNILDIFAVAWDFGKTV
jgi:hypothetical protein